MDPQRANSYPNEAAAFSSTHNGRFSNQFVPSQPPQSSAFVPAYAPGAPGFGSVSTSPIMPNVDAHQNNLKLFNRFKLELSEESLPTYVSTAEKLAHWMRKEQAFYPEAKSYIVNFLELAQVTLYRACRITPSPKHPFHISQCPPQAANLAEAYVRLVQAVRKFEYKFVEPDFRSRLADVFSTVDPIPGKPTLSSNRPRPPPVTAHYGPTPPPHSPSVPGGGPQSVFFSTQGITPTPSSPTTPFPMFSPGHANALPAGSSHTYAIPSLPSTSPSGARPLSRPGSAAQTHAPTAHSPLVGSAMPQASPSVTSASTSTPSPSLSNISAGQTNTKPKAKAKKLSVFGALDFLSSDLEWYTKKKGKSVDNKAEGGDEKTKEEAKVEGEVPIQQEPTGAIPVEESKEMDAETTEHAAATTVGEEKEDVVAHEDKPAELEVAEAPLAPAAQLEEPKDEVSEPILETGTTEREDEGIDDAAVQVLDKTEAKDDEGDRADEDPMDVATEDDDASDKVEQMLTGGFEPDSGVRVTEAVTVVEDTPAEGGAVVSPSVPETVVKDVQEEGKQDAPQSMDVDKVETDISHSIVQGHEQMMQVEEAPTQKAPSDEPSAPPKRKKKRRGPPGIPANQIVGALPMLPIPAAMPSSRESSPETTLASAVASPTRKTSAHSARALKRSMSGSSSESDAPLSSRLVARRSVSDTKPKRTAPRVPRRTYSVQGPDKVEKTDNADAGRSTRTSSLPGGTGNEDVEMQEADDITSPGQPSVAPQTMAESQASSSSRHSSLHAVTAMEEGELTLRDIDSAMTQEDGEVTPTATARPLEDTGPAVSDAPDARRATFFDERMVVLGFARGTPRGQSITISFDLNIDQAATVKRWTERYNTNDDPADLRCVSLACHPYADCSSMLDELECTLLDTSKVFARVPAEWPLRSHPRLALGEQGEPGSVLPVTRLSIDHDNLLDISVRAHEGHNTVEITSVYGDTTEFVFVIHLHPPTSQQCDELEKRRAENVAWKLLLKNMSTFQIPKIRPLLNLDTELARAKV